MATTTRRLITAEEFLDMDLGEGFHELVRGEVIEVPPPKHPHGRVCMKIGYRLEFYGRESGYGYVLSNDTAVVTERGPDTVRGADLMFYSKARLPESRLDDSALDIVPDLVVEVVSPGNRASEIRSKIHEYLNAGVFMVWIAYPQRRTLVIYRRDDPIPITLTEADTLDNLPELPGFRCPVAEFFV
ncbi:MAG: Uma2 family endonuclease [Isosphaeraceae bacterium]